MVVGPGDAWEARDDATAEAYRQAFQAHTTASWELVEAAQGDLLGLLVDRVPAVVGAEVVLALAVMARDRPDDDAGRETLVALMGELRPAIGWTLLVALADGFANAEAMAFDARPAGVRAELARAIRRLLALELPDEERAALARVQSAIGARPPS